jgi:hypothetical protein
MKPLRIFLIAVAVAIASCGGSSSTPSNFTGAAWSVTLTTTLDCGGQTTSDSQSTAIVFTENNSDIGYVSNDGCDYQFALSGDTATLTNAPVTCSALASDGSTLLLNIDSYTATCADGHHLTIVASGTVTDSGATCDITLDGSGTR